MAHGKLRYIKPGSHGSGGRLARALSYAANKEKTEGGIWVTALNCPLDGTKAPARQMYEQMMATKNAFSQTYGRQGYELILSFRENENDREKCWKILVNAAEELFGNRYETLVCMHTNTEHLHGHIILNSVSFMDGYKFRYEKGEWEERFQSVIDKYALQEGYSMDRDNLKKREKDAAMGQGIPDVDTRGEDRGNWTWVNKADMDEAIRQASDYLEFEKLMRDMGYRMDYGKQAGKLCLKICKSGSGQQKYRRCTEKTLGYAYTLEGITQRIAAKGKMYPLIAAREDMPVVKEIRYKARYKRVFRKWDDLSAVEKTQIKKSMAYRLTGYRVNWKVVGKYRRQARTELEKRDLLIRYEVDSFQKLADVRGQIEDRQQTCREKLGELRKQEQLYAKEIFLYKKIHDHMEKGNVPAAQELARQLQEDGHTVQETAEFVQRLEDEKKKIYRELSGLRKDARQMEEIQTEYAERYDLPLPDREETQDKQADPEMEKGRTDDSKENGYGRGRSHG